MKVAVNTEVKHAKQIWQVVLGKQDVEKVKVIQEISLGYIEHVCLMGRFCEMLSEQPNSFFYLYALKKEFKQLEYFIILHKG